MARTLTAEQVGGIALRHDEARRSATQIRRITLEYPDMTIDDAYACQQAWIDRQQVSGASVVGHKIGLTSRAMQRTMQIDEPDFGTLLDYMVVDSGAVWHASDFCDPQIEVELAFVLGERLFGADVTRDEVHDASAYVVPALELIDARSHRVDPHDRVSRTVRDTIADNAADAGVVVGATRADPRAIDLRWVPAILKRNGIVEETGVAAAVLDDPGQGIVWLAHRLANYGVALEAGEIVLSGSFTRPVVCRAGDEFEVDYRDLGLVTVQFS
jgi:2-oxo-hept-3-ene-1,7-dioate hydratase